MPPSTGSCWRSVGRRLVGVGWGQDAGARPGDHVVFPGPAGVWVEVDEERLLVCRVTELLGVLEEVEEPSGSGLTGDESLRED